MKKYGSFELHNRRSSDFISSYHSGACIFVDSGWMCSMVGLFSGIYRLRYANF